MPALKLPSPHEPVSQVRRIPILESGDELVDFLVLCPDLILDRPRFDYERATVLRKSVVERLCRANSLLPAGHRLAIIEGWRAPEIQERMYRAIWNQIAAEHPDWSQSKLRRIVNRYSAPMDRRVPPPHTTGAAVDLLLANMDGKPFDHCTPFGPSDTNGFAFDAPGLSNSARRTRSILAKAMIEAGLTNYPSEYWHWSFGDQGWAYRGGHPKAVYGHVTYSGWSPAIMDVGAQPLKFLDG